MKRTIVSIALAALVGCGGGGWSTEEKKALLRTCMGGTHELSLCTCALKKAQKQWESYDDYDAIYRERGGLRPLVDIIVECQGLGTGSPKPG